MTREDKIRRVQLGIIRSTNAAEITNETDYYLLGYYSNARPLAEALVDVIDGASPLTEPQHTPVAGDRVRVVIEGLVTFTSTPGKTAYLVDRWGNGSAIHTEAEHVVSVEVVKP